MKILAATPWPLSPPPLQLPISPPSSPPIVQEEQQHGGRLKCGTVYTWDCTGEELEQFAVECALCDDRPICKLSEFALHMEIWHQQAEEAERMLMAIDVCDQVATPKPPVTPTTPGATIEPFEQVLMVANNEFDGDNGDDVDRIGEVNDGDDLDNVSEISDIGEIGYLDEIGDIGEISDIGDIDYMGESEDIDGFGAVEVDDINTNGDIYATGHHEHVDSNTTTTTIVDANGDQPNVQLDDSENFDPTKLNANQQIQFALNEPLTYNKLTTSHIERLIALYAARPRLWQHTHIDYHDREGNRRAWQQIANEWSAHCGRTFSRKEVHMRLATLHKRYQRQCHVNAHSTEPASMAGERCFKYFEQMQFLKDEQPFLTRRSLAERENAKLLEIYAHFPLLWHRDERGGGGGGCSDGNNNSRRAQQQQQQQRGAAALQAISTALSLCNIQMPAAVVERRLRTLHKNFRLEKLRQLQCKQEQRTFVARFKHYAQMAAFLDDHVPPFECATCGQAYQRHTDYRKHVPCNSSALTTAALEAQQQELFALLSSTAPSTPNSLSSLSSDSAIDVRTPSEQNSTTTEQLELEFDEALELNDFGDFEAVVAEQQDNTSITSNSNESGQTTIATPTTASKARDQLFLDGEETAYAWPPAEEEAQSHQQQDDCDGGGSGSGAVDDDELLVKVDCGPFSYDLNLVQQQLEQQLDEQEQQPLHDNTNNVTTTDNNKVKTRSYARLNVQQTRKLIALYRDCTQLWDPAHVAYASRKSRSLAWRTLTARMNRKCGGGATRYTWRMLHRKITDFVKYYKREHQRLDSKWYFYDEFRFIDKVMNATSQVQKTLQHKTNTTKIIGVYRAYPQLWDTNHADYSKRKERQRHFTHMCQRLLDEADIQLSVEKLKQRLIEFRCNYRLEKQQRLAAEQRNEPFSSHYEFYEELQFLEMHVAPFQCSACKMNYKRHSDYVQHVRSLHEVALPTPIDATDAMATTNQRSRRLCRPQVSGDAALEHVCHICGMAFTARNNLVYHLKRHLGDRQHSCHLCPKVFYNSTSLRVHVRSHTKELPYICELCGARFVNTSKLNQHRKRHSNQRDFACDKCEKTFYTAFELDRHQRRHLNIRDKICAICGRAFFVGSAYYAHMRLHSDIKRYACELCDMKFAQYAGLYKHRKRHHAD